MRNKTFLKTVAWLTLVAMINACSVYRIKSVEKIDDMRKHLVLTSDNTVLYVHANGEIKELKNVERSGHEISGDLVIPDAKELSVYLDGMAQASSDKKAEFILPRVKSSKASVSKEESMVELDRIVKSHEKLKVKNQFHFHLSDAKVSSSGHLTFNDSKVVKMEILEKTKAVDGKEIGSIIWKVFLALLLTFLLILIIVAIVACNCPRIYLYNGHDWLYNNALFAGATNTSLERIDTKKLDDFTPKEKELSMEIRNEEAEVQYLNDLSLWAVMHQENERIVSDKQGNFYAVKETLEPRKVLDAVNNDRAALVQKADDKAYTFDQLSARAYQGLYTTFDGLNAQKDLRLILRVKNSEFAGVVNESVKKAMGSAYEDWASKNRTKSKETLDQAFEEKGAALSVLVKDGKHWIKVDQIEMVGNVAYHEVVIPVKKEFIHNGAVQLQFAAGFNLWSLDQIAVDQSPQVPLQAFKIKASTASLDGQERSSEILEKDKTYLTLRQGDAVKVLFKDLPQEDGKKRSLFLQGQGYYIPAHEPTNKPYWSALMKLQQPYGISKFAFDLYMNQYQMR